MSVSVPQIPVLPTRITGRLGGIIRFFSGVFRATIGNQETLQGIQAFDIDMTIF
jgi:hypothetical protein